MVSAIFPCPEPQNTEQWPTKSPVLVGVNCNSAVLPLLILTSKFNSRKRSPCATSVLFSTSVTGWSFFTVISLGVNVNLLAVTSIERVGDWATVGRLMNTVMQRMVPTVKNINVFFTRLSSDFPVQVDPEDH